MTDIGRGITKEETDVRYIYYFIRAVHTRLCGARSGSLQLNKIQYFWLHNMYKPVGMVESENAQREWYTENNRQDVFPHLTHGVATSQYAGAWAVIPKPDHNNDGNHTTSDDNALVVINMHDRLMYMHYA